MPLAPVQHLTAPEYLVLERQARVKSEFLGGEVFAMAGGSRRHSRIAVNLAGALNRLAGRGPCQVFNSDMRLKIEATGLYTYPDIQVACGKLAFEDEQEDTLLNPKLIVEVLSNSTAAWDRGQKFWHYRHLESLSEYLLVSQDAWLVEHYRRQPNGAWLLETIEGPKGLARLRAFPGQISLDEIYANTGLNAAAKPARAPSEAPNKILLKRKPKKSSKVKQ
jgi:Uma2 family endonuclease